MPYNQEIIYSKIQKMFESIINPEVKESVPLEKKQLIHVDSFSSLNAQCLNKRKACFIALLDGRVNEGSQKIFDSNIEVLNSFVNTTVENPFSFLYVNATCHEDLLQQFNLGVDSLPNAIVYIPSKEIYTTMIGTFDKESIDSFINRVARGKVSMQNINKESFKFQDRDCSLIVEESFASTDDDDIMKEMMEEIRRKEEEEEKLKNDSKQKKKGKKKKKKDL